MGRATSPGEVGQPPTGDAKRGDALTRAVAHLAAVQHPTGYWEAEMVWNSMLLSQWVIVQAMEK